MHTPLYSLRRHFIEEDYMAICLFSFLAIFCPPEKIRGREIKVNVRERENNCTCILLFYMKQKFSFINMISLFPTERLCRHSWYSLSLWYQQWWIVIFFPCPFNLHNNKRTNYLVPLNIIITYCVYSFWISPEPDFIPDISWSLYINNYKELSQFKRASQESPHPNVCNAMIISRIRD